MFKITYLSSFDSHAVLQISGKLNLSVMKTKLTLTILGVYNMLFGLAAMLASATMAEEIVNSENLDVIRMGELFHIGLGHGK